MKRVVAVAGAVCIMACLMFTGVKEEKLVRITRDLPRLEHRQ